MTKMAGNLMNKFASLGFGYEYQSRASIRAITFSRRCFSSIRTLVLASSVQRYQEIYRKKRSLSILMIPLITARVPPRAREANKTSRRISRLRPRNKSS